MIRIECLRLQCTSRDIRILDSIIESLVTLDWINAIAGFGVGTLVGLTGFGGGALMTPIMVMLFGISPHTAVGTDLWFAAITKIFGGWVHGKRGTVDWQVLRRLFSGSIPRSEEHTSELQSLMRISYAVFCLKKQSLIFFFFFFSFYYFIFISF